MNADEQRDERQDTEGRDDQAQADEEQDEDREAEAVAERMQVDAGDQHDERQGEGLDKGREGEAHEPLRLLIADEQQERVDQMARIALELGEEVVARELRVDAVRQAAEEVRPDVALVGLFERSDEHALDLISEIVKGAICPVIALIDKEDPEFVKEAALRGVFAYVSPIEADQLRGALDVALRRFHEQDELAGTLAGRASVERAKGILMERYVINERQAFERLRRHARNSGQRVSAVADAVL